MSLHKEISFDVEICGHLSANRCLYEDKDVAGFVRGLALFPAAVLVSKKQELDGKKQELESKKQELPGDLAERIAAQGRKGDKEEILNLVVDLLTVQEMSTSELATHLDRTVEYVRRTYIKPLVDAGRIQSSNPDNPTDPGLTYRAIMPADKFGESLDDNT